MEIQGTQWTKVVQVTEDDWVKLQLALAELKARVHDLELRLKSVERGECDTSEPDL